jgi:hypothetical protein
MVEKNTTPNSGDVQQKSVGLDLLNEIIVYLTA